MKRLKKNLFGFVLQQYYRGDKTPYAIVREDGLREFPEDPKGYFLPRLFPNEVKAFPYVKGRVLDIGCGAGRHALLFRKKGHDVTGIDTDNLCVKLSKARGLKKVFVEDIFRPKKLRGRHFDTVWLAGNNLGVAGKPERVKKLFQILDELTNSNAVVLSAGFDFQKTRDPVHLRYHRLQKKRRKFPGSMKLRIEYKDLIGEWFWWLHTPSKLLESSLKGTPWKVQKYFREKNGRYMAIIKKGAKAGLDPA